MMMTFLNTESSSSLSVEETVRLLNSDIEYGLSPQEIKERRKLFSYNEFEIGDTDPLWKKYLEKFKEPMILLLLASAFVSVLLKQFDDALSITIAILIVVTVAFIQVSLIGTLNLECFLQIFLLVKYRGGVNKTDMSLNYLILSNITSFNMII